MTPISSGSQPGVAHSILCSSSASRLSAMGTLSVRTEGIPWMIFLVCRDWYRLQRTHHPLVAVSPSTLTFNTCEKVILGARWPRPFLGGVSEDRPEVWGPMPRTVNGEVKSVT